MENFLIVLPATKPAEHYRSFQEFLRNRNIIFQVAPYGAWEQVSGTFFEGLLLTDSDGVLA